MHHTHDIAAIAVCAALAFASVSTFATDLSVRQKPQAPCGTEPYPSYPALDAPPVAIFWKSDDIGKRWTPPECTGWGTGSATSVVGLAGYYHDERDVDAMLARIGAISSLRSVRYWSVTDKAWSSLFTTATALDGPDPAKRRGDFSLPEIRKARDLYFLANDSGSRDDVVWQLRVTDMGNGLIILKIENVTALRWFLVPLAAPGGIQTTYFLEREPAGTSWRMYSLTRVLYASPLIAHFAPGASYINRAVALYRHYADLATDSSPPAMP